MGGARPRQSELTPERVAWCTQIHSLVEAGNPTHNDPFSENARHIDIENQGRPQTLIAHQLSLTSALRLNPLPCETLSHIFSECRRMDPSAPMTVSQVCRGWRQVALGHRALWSHIELGRRETGLSRASTWADRAGAVPLNLVIRYSNDTHGIHMIPWLQQMASKIASLTFLHMDKHSRNRLLPALPPLPRLEVLQILGLEDIDPDMRWIVQLLKGSLGLRSLSLSGVSGLEGSTSLKNVATRLTHLSIGALSHIDYYFPLRIDAVLEVILACTGLQSLECHALRAEDIDEPLAITLPSLSSLSIGDGPETCLILKYLYVPRLRSFRLVRGRILNENEEEVDMPFMEDSRNGYIQLFVDCLRRLHETCSPQITKVIWDRTTVDLGVLNECVPYFQAMEELECYGLAKIGEVAPCNFLRTDVNEIAYPQLRSISFTRCTLSAITSGTIEAVISCGGPPSRLIVEDCTGANDKYLSLSSNKDEEWSPNRYGMENGAARPSRMAFGSLTLSSDGAAA